MTHWLQRSINARLFSNGDSMNLSLPSSSFVPVATQRLRAPTVVWTSGGKFTEQWAVDNAFCIRQGDEPADAYFAEERTQLADRYGGHGVGSGGGSGRCATFGQLQIKGVGRTPLVTREADRFHTSGTVSLSEAAHEVIWSQLLSVVLPYGVVPLVAIVNSKGAVPRGNSNGPDTHWQRTLLMREFALRPAHYLRNLYFETPKASTGGLCQDASRVRDTINMLHLGFEQIFGKQVAGTKGIEKMNHGLRIMAKRFAAQIAASFAKRIFHGALNCSNIALDGRFLDFGIAAFVERYQRQAWAKGWADQWTQDGPLLRTMRLLRFQLHKYFRDDSASKLISEAELVAEFQTALTGRLEIEMLKMTGVPEDVASIYPAGDRQRLFRCLRDIYSRGAGEVFTSFDADADTVGANPPPRRGPQFDLNQILALASTCTNSSDLDRTLTEALKDAQLRKEFAACYSHFMDGSVARFNPDTRTTAKIYMALQAIRLNADLSFLQRKVLLDEKLAPFDSNPQGVGDFINATVAHAWYFLQQNHPDLPGTGAKQQIAALLRMGTGMPDFVMARLATAAPGVVVGMKKLLAGNQTDGASAVHSHFDSGILCNIA